MCRERDSNPHGHFWPRDFKSLVSTNFTTSASEILSEKRDSNPRPRPWQGRALPTELFPHRRILTAKLRLIIVIAKCIYTI